MRPRRLICLGLLSMIAFATAQATSPRVLAQGNAFNPYSNLTNPYQPFVYPSAPSNYALPGAARMSRDFQRGFGAPPSPFDQTFDPLNTDRDRFSDDGVGVRRPNNGIGVPYTQAYRQYDRDFGRLNNANERADKSFYEGQQERYRLYLEATREKDPKKRAQMLKAVNEQAARAGRDTSFDKKAAAATSTPKATPAKPSTPLLDPLSSQPRPVSRRGSTATRPGTTKPETAKSATEKPNAATIHSLRRGPVRQPNTQPRMSDPLSSPLESDRVKPAPVGSTPARPSSSTPTAPDGPILPGSGPTTPPER